MKILILALAPVVLMSVSCTSAHAVKAARAANAPVESTITTISSGTISAEQQAVLNFSTVGRIAEVLVRAGDHVKTGQRLASLENIDLKVGAMTAQSELRRTVDLAKEKLVSTAALDEGRRAAEIAQMNYARSIIVAPFDGLVTEVNLRKGEIAQIQTAPDKPAIRLIDLKPRLVKGEIDEVDLGKVRPGLEARIKVPALENKKFKAKVTSVVPFVSSNREQDRTSQIELKFDESEEIIPVGASADIEILIEKKENALTVPARAMLGNVKQRYVYRVTNDHLERVDIRVGIGNYERREVLSGIKARDVIAIPADDYDLKAGDKVTITLQPWP